VKTGTRETAIDVRSVSKKFCKNIKWMMIYGLLDVLGGSVGNSGNRSRLRREEFWALRDVSFRVRRGEAVGLIGLNGSGKSTVLKLVNGIFLPDLGEIIVRGKTGALIEAGVGFHPALTGRENIYLNGTILGMHKRDIDEQFDSIVDFSETREFLDSPVKNYSSGMMVRLGFSIAVHSAPDILLIDEILAVGDVPFQKKCFEKISSLKRDGQTTIVFVSHDMEKVRSVCDRCILLDHGRLVDSGSVDRISRRYLTA
jgi:lipopolysaccharide transport system ATP-binding protein